jgi:hypothetical protein
MSDLADAIEALENDAQHLRDNLPNLDDPPAADQLKISPTSLRIGGWRSFAGCDRTLSRSISFKVAFSRDDRGRREATRPAKQ